MSTIASSGAPVRLAVRSAVGSPAWPTTSNPSDASRLAIPSRRRTSSSAITTRRDATSRQLRPRLTTRPTSRTIRAAMAPEDLVTDERRLDEARLGAFLDAALDSVIMVDASGSIVEFNAAAERTFGYGRDHAIGSQLADLVVPPSLRERHRRAFEHFVDTGEGMLFGQRLELTGMRADGSEFPVELTLTRVSADPLLVCGAIRDA